MQYRPFSLIDYPRLRALLEPYPVSFMAQRLVKNIRYFEQTIHFLRVFPSSQEEVSIALDKDEIDVNAFGPQTMQALRYVIYNLDQADRIDVPLSQEKKKREFDVTSTFRYFNQFYGGKRFVSLCHDLIDANMGDSLQPFMYEELIIAIFNSFNKNPSRDVAGLLDALLGYIEEIGFSDEALVRIYSAFGSKLQEETYRRFALACLSRDTLAPAMRRLVADALIPKRFDPRAVAPHLDAADLVKFPAEELGEILEAIPGGMGVYVEEIFEAFGKDVDPALVERYLANPARDVNLVLDAPFYLFLPAETKQKITRGRIFSPKTRKTEIIEYYQSLGDDQSAKEEVLQACDEYGFSGLRNALEGKPFNLTGFSSEDLLAVLPFVDIHHPEICKRINAFLRQITDYSPYTPYALQLFLALEGSDYEASARYAVKRNYIFDKAGRLAVADHFGFIEELGYKEWKYHA